MKKILTTGVFFVLVCVSTLAQARTWQIDPDHSEIRFEIQHIFSTVSGRFSEFNGDIFFDPENPGNSRFDFSVAVKSVNTLNNKRDNHLRSKDFFDADRFPVMTFTSTRITRIGPDRYALEGTLTIKDVAKPVKIEFSYQGPQAHPFDQKSLVAGFAASFDLERLAYHVGNGKFLKLGVVGEIVRVTLSMEALTGK